jgi:aspartate/methionine/tyrosine aminotransferase
VTLLDYDVAMTSRDLCTRLLEDAGVLLMPGSTLEMEGAVRIGFGNGTEMLRDGPAATSRVQDRLLPDGDHLSPRAST